MTMNHEWIEERKANMLSAFNLATQEQTLDAIMYQCALDARSQYFGAKSCELLLSMRNEGTNAGVAVEEQT